MSAEVAGGRARVVALYGPKAGVGTTVVACNLAVALRLETGARVVLLDAHADLGNVATLMGLESARGDNSGEQAGPIRFSHPSGVQVWTASRNGSAGGRPTTTDDLEQLVEAAVVGEGFVLVDIPSGGNPLSSHSLHRADLVLVVLTPEEAALLHGQSLLQFLADRAEAGRVGVVVNRSQSTSGLPDERLERAFGKLILGWLPSAGSLVVESVNSGRPFVESAPAHALSRAVARLARRLVAGPDLGR